MKGVGVEWQDCKLPIPNYIEYTNNGYLVGWQIDGYFATKEAIEYLNDVIGRITVTMREQKPRRLPWKPDLVSADHYYPKIRKLQELSSRLESRIKKAHIPKRADSFTDYAFWGIKLFTEDRIREFGEGTPVPYHIIEDWAIVQFVEELGKERSTIRAKCRSIWNWYNERDWQLPKDERGYKMGREENMRRVNAIKKAKTRAAIKSILEDIFLREEVMTKTGKPKAVAIAKILGINEKTVRTHLKEMKEEKERKSDF